MVFGFSVWNNGCGLCLSYFDFISISYEVTVNINHNNEAENIKQNNLRKSRGWRYSDGIKQLFNN